MRGHFVLYGEVGVGYYVCPLLRSVWGQGYAGVSPEVGVEGSFVWGYEFGQEPRDDGESELVAIVACESEEMVGVWAFDGQGDVSAAGEEVVLGRACSQQAVDEEQLYRGVGGILHQFSTQGEGAVL